MAIETKTDVWPEKLTLRDTKVYADEGQRIFTTATGYGYEKQEYVRADIASRPSISEGVEAEAVDGEAREWLIRKSGYFYRPNRAGYTSSKFEAGRYTKADAEREAAIEPWHMKAIHESEWPDDAPSAAVSHHKDRIAALSAELAGVRKERDEAQRLFQARDEQLTAEFSVSSKMARLAEEAAARAERNWKNMQRLWDLARGDDPDDLLDDRPRCRDCADEDGTCPHSGFACDPQTGAEQRIRALASRATTAEAEVTKVREALGDLLSWFPKEPSKPEWRLEAGPSGADDAVAHARSLIAKGDQS
jgi:hypothetical protein